MSAALIGARPVFSACHSSALTRRATASQLRHMLRGGVTVVDDVAGENAGAKIEMVD